MSAIVNSWLHVKPPLIFYIFYLLSSLLFLLLHLVQHSLLTVQLVITHLVLAPSLFS